MSESRRDKQIGISRKPIRFVDQIEEGPSLVTASIAVSVATSPRLVVTVVKGPWAAPRFLVAARAPGGPGGGRVNDVRRVVDKPC